MHLITSSMQLDTPGALACSPCSILLLSKAGMGGVPVQAYLSLKENRVIDAWVAEGERWVLEGEGEPAVKFKNTTLNLHLNWLDRLTFADGDVFTWKKVGIV